MKEVLSLLLFGLINLNNGHSIYHRSFPSPEGYHHGRTAQYFHSIRSQPADSLKDRFSEQYAKVITNGKTNGYFSSDGVPYHSVETLMVEAPDYGHETTSEAFSEYVWLTAMNCWASGDSSDFKAAWNALETYIIPTQQDQPTSTAYNPATPASYAPEEPNPDDYPVTINRQVSVGQDDLNDELAAVYGDGSSKISQFYATHWLLDVDNIYKFGRHESGSASDRNVYVNSYQRGANESVWRTVPEPEWETFKYGGVKYIYIYIYDAYIRFCDLIICAKSHY